MALPQRTIPTEHDLVARLLHPETGRTDDEFTPRRDRRVGNRKERDGRERYLLDAWRGIKGEISGDVSRLMHAEGGSGASEKDRHVLLRLCLMRSKQQQTEKQCTTDEHDAISGI